MGTKHSTKKAEKRLHELDELRARAAVLVDELTDLGADAFASVERANSQLYSAVEEIQASTRSVVEHAQRQRRSIDAARTHLTDVTEELDARVRDEIARITMSVDAELARLEARRSTVDEQLQAAAERAIVHIESVVDAELQRVDELRATVDDARVAVPPDPAPEPEPEPEPVIDDARADVAPLSWTTFEEFEASFASSTADDGPQGSAPIDDARPDVVTPAPAVLTAPPAIGVSVATVETGRSQLLASVTQLSRAAADGWLRVELVHRAVSGRAVALLRLTAHGMLGGVEYHDIPGRTSSATRAPITVDAHELAHAIQVDGDADDVTLELDGGIVVGTVLVPARNAVVPMLAGERRKIESVHLPPADRDDPALDTLAGRFVLPSRVASSLRSRRVVDVDLLMIGETPCLSARVPGPADETVVTIELPLSADTADAGPPERRESPASAVNQLVSALSTASAPDDLVEVIANGVGYARRRAAAHPALPEGVIAGLVRDGTDAMRSAAAGNPSIPQYAIEHAVADESAAVRAAVASNPRVPPALLLQLVRDDSAQVRARVVQNVAVPPEMLALIGQDPDASVRAAVAAREDCPAETLIALAGDAFPAVCASVARNPNCPTELLDQLLSIVPEVVLSNPRTPEHVLVAGTRVESATLRAAVAGNPSTPARVLQALARDADRNVVSAVATNPSTPPSVQRKARRRSERAASTRR